MTETTVTPPTLPDPDLVGEIRDWVLPTSGPVLTFRGRLLGVASSRKSLHRGHYGREFAAPGEQCRACRWFEPRVFREYVLHRDEIDLADVSDVDLEGHRAVSIRQGLHPGRFLLHRAGRTIVPGETTYASHEWLTTADKLIHALATRPADDEPYLTGPVGEVLRVAREHDPDLSQAYLRLVEATS
jgi:hypothetical protein